MNTSSQSLTQNSFDSNVNCPRLYEHKRISQEAVSCFLEVNRTSILRYGKLSLGEEGGTKCSNTATEIHLNIELFPVVVCYFRS